MRLFTLILFLVLGTFIPFGQIPSENGPAGESLREILRTQK
jgi:hypothetical protein